MFIYGIILIALAILLSVSSLFLAILTGNTMDQETNPKKYWGLVLWTIGALTTAMTSSGFATIIICAMLGVD